VWETVETKVGEVRMAKAERERRERRSRKKKRREGKKEGGKETIRNGNTKDSRRVGDLRSRRRSSKVGGRNKEASPRKIS